LFISADVEKESDGTNGGVAERIAEFGATSDIE
jgi:hypothetical protein